MAMRSSGNIPLTLASRIAFALTSGVDITKEDSGQAFYCEFKVPDNKTWIPYLIYAYGIAEAGGQAITVYYLKKDAKIRAAFINSSAIPAAATYNITFSDGASLASQALPIGIATTQQTIGLSLIRLLSGEMIRVTKQFAGAPATTIAVRISVMEYDAQ